MNIFLHGFVVCFGLIVSIGAQNAFLLKQGLLKQHVFWVAFICFLCDVVLMSLGILGLGSLIAQSMWASLILALLGAIFLFVYGSRAFINAYQGNTQLIASTENQPNSLKKTVLITLAITLLNPHVYIDTVVIIGSIGGTLNLNEKMLFLAGTLICSFLWFFGLGYSATKLSTFFQKPQTWQLLDCITGLIMYLIAGSLAWYVIERLTAH